MTTIRCGLCQAYYDVEEAHFCERCTRHYCSWCYGQHMASVHKQAVFMGMRL